jgi:ankyrin repeat protein
MKHLKTYENFSPTHYDIYDAYALINATYDKDLRRVKNIIKAGINLNTQDKSDRNRTALIYSAIYDYMDIIEELIKAGADWNIKDDNGKDFLFYLHTDNEHKIKKQFPEQYKEYLMKKEAEKYNL